jgi:hypothetical protein
MIKVGADTEHVRRRLGERLLDVDSTPVTDPIYNFLHHTMAQAPQLEHVDALVNDRKARHHRRLATIAVTQIVSYCRNFTVAANVDGHFDKRVFPDLYVLELLF